MKSIKTIFVPAFSKQDINRKEISKISKKLPKQIAIAYSVQYKHIAEKIRQELSKSHKITAFIQVLGCSKPSFSAETKAVLLISSGRFHAVSLALETGLPIYIYEHGRTEKISEKETEELRKKKKTQYIKFLNSEKIGIFVSLKPGQENMKEAINLKKFLEAKGKKPYILIGNELSSSQFENFQMDSWVNTACPRLDMDFPVINIKDIRKFSGKNIYS